MRSMRLMQPIVGLGLTLLLLGSLLAGVATAQTPEGQAAGQTAPAAEGAASADAAKVPESFERGDKLEDMRYQHLWIAYGAIWLIAFGFVYRTWKTSQATGAEIDALKSRLAALEGRDGRD